MGTGVKQQWDYPNLTVELLTWKRLRRCSRQDARIVQVLAGKDAKSRLHIKAQLLLKPSMRSTVFAIRG
jgi:hypothetical protein